MPIPTDLPDRKSLRWPVLVVLDELPGSPSILEVQDAVARRLDGAAAAAEELDPDTGHPLLTERLVEAIADLHTAGAVESDEKGRVSITDLGRRMTEEEASELPDAQDEPSTEKPRLRHYLLAAIQAYFDKPGH